MCHNKDACPPCTTLTEKMCAGGHKVTENVFLTSKNLLLFFFRQLQCHVIQKQRHVIACVEKYFHVGSINVKESVMMVTALKTRKSASSFAKPFATIVGICVV